MSLSVELSSIFIQNWTATHDDNLSTVLTNVQSQNITKKLYFVTKCEKLPPDGSKWWHTKRLLFRDSLQSDEARGKLRFLSIRTTERSPGLTQALAACPTYPPRVSPGHRRESVNIKSMDTISTFPSNMTQHASHSLQRRQLQLRDMNGK
jgi:hypothetical protein